MAENPYIKKSRGERSEQRLPLDFFIRVIPYVWVVRDVGSEWPYLQKGVSGKVPVRYEVPFVFSPRQGTHNRRLYRVLYNLLYLCYSDGTRGGFIWTQVQSHGTSKNTKGAG